MKKPTTAPVRRLLRVVAIAALLAPSVTVTGCAAAAGRNATAGAVDELRRTLQDLRTEGGKPPLEQAAANATRGTIDELAAPEHREQLGLAVGTATESAIDGALDSLERRGAWGGGPPSSYGTPVGSFGGDFSAGLALGLSRQLELGADGSGPLAKSLAGLAQEM